MIMNSRNVIFTALGALLWAHPALAQEAGKPAATPDTSGTAAVPNKPDAAASESSVDSEETPSATAEGGAVAGENSEVSEPVEETQAEAAPEPEVEVQAEEVVSEEESLHVNPDAVPDLRKAKQPSQRYSIGLEPSAPQATAIAGGVTPAFGQPSQSSSDWVFDIHGLLLLPLRVGINERENPQAGQKSTVLHTPPVTPGDLETFEHTGTTPDPWAQLNFSYGNRDVTATVIIAARTISNANSYFDPSDQLGINDAFITFHPKSEGKAKYNVHVGAFANRYGIMGEYDLGRYGTPTLARLGGMGATGTGSFELSDTVQLSTEIGVMGQLNKTPVGVEPAGWNGYSDPNAGTSFVGHAHAALGLGESVTVGAHAMSAFAQDDRATTTTQKDGRISVYGADLRLSMHRYGHFYFGYGLTDAKTSRSVSSVIQVLNARGGLGLMREYFGLESEGTGQLNTFSAEYDLSLGNLLRYPNTYDGEGPDFVISGFGIGTAVNSPVPTADGVFKLKYGTELTYSFIKWMGAGLRYDRVLPDTKDSTQTHAIISPRLIFKSDWASRDQVTLQYSGYLYGSNSAPVVGTPPAKDPTVKPDNHVVSLTASMWW